MQFMCHSRDEGGTESGAKTRALSTTNQSDCVTNGWEFYRCGGEETNDMLTANENIC
jgi:hypothetical protein